MVQWGCAQFNECIFRGSTSRYGMSVFVQNTGRASPRSWTEGVNIDPNVILQAYEKLRSLTQAVVVEGVGGFRVPLTRTFDTADLASMLELPVILVVGMRLGCINHALLSAESIRARGLNLVGWVANSMGQPMNKLEENIQAIDQRIGAKKLAYVPYLRNASAEAAAPYFGHPDLSVLPGDF